MPVAAAVATVGAAAIGASSASKAAKKSAQAVGDASAQATALDREIYLDLRYLLAPSMLAGADARARQMLMTGSSKEQVKAYLDSVRSAVGPTGEAARASDQELQTRYASLYRDWSGGDRHRGIRYDDFNDYLDANGVNTSAAAGTPTSGAGAGDNYAWVDEAADGGIEAWLRSTPGYQFNLDEGNRARERSAAARGDLYSGGFAREIARYNQDYADNEWDDLWTQYGQLAGDGTDATSTTVNVAGQYGQNATGNMMEAGRARASGYEQAGDAWGNFWGSAVPGGVGAVTGYGSKRGWW